MKSIEKSKTKTQEYINSRTLQKSCFKCGRSWQHRNGECQTKGKICTKCGKPNHFAKVCKSINIDVVNYEDDNTFEYMNSCDTHSCKTGMQNSKVQFQKFMANITIGSVYMRPEMKSNLNEISIHHKRNSVYIIFHCRQNETNFVSVVARDKRPIK